MYYYIFDVKKVRKRAQIEAIRDYLAELGISGEFTFVSAAQSAEELAELGIKKGYSTMVAAGSDDLASKVANVLAGRDEALGVLPLMASESLHKLIGADTWQKACETLRFRKIKDVHIGKTGDGKHFLTYLDLNLSKPTEVTLEFKDFIAQAHVENLIISNFHPQIDKKHPDHLEIIMQSHKRENIVNSIKSWFKRTKTGSDEDITFIRARSLRVFTKSSHYLYEGDSKISRTPQYLEASDEKIRLIVSKK